MNFAESIWANATAPSSLIPLIATVITGGFGLWWITGLYHRRDCNGKEKVGDIVSEQVEKGMDQVIANAKV